MMTANSDLSFSRNFYLQLAMLFLFLVQVPAANGQPIPVKEQKPNIILILTDDQGWGDLSISGNSAVATPNLDLLARNGVSFQRFYVSPVCSPTRAEILTGRYHFRSGVYSTSEGGERIDLDEVLLAEVLRKEGYRTAGYGKWHSGAQYPYHPNGRGFEDFYGFCSGHWGNYFDPMLEHNGEVVKGNGFIIDDLTDKAIEFVTANREEPFFLYVPYNTPHSPMQVPASYWERFKEKELLPHRYSGQEDVVHSRAALAMVENVDWNVGRLLERVENLDLLDNTIVIFLSDNGPNGFRWNGDLKGRKGSVDEGGVRSPFFIYWKGKIEGGKTMHKVASAIDLFPTLLSLTGIDYVSEKPLDGKDLSSLLVNEEVEWPNRFVFSYWEKKASIRNESFLLDEKDQLFDLRSDPGQYHVVSDQFPEIYNQMIKEKQARLAEVLAELPEKDTRSFALGHPDFKFNQLPARDAVAHGNIKRSNRFPNSSFFTNWTSTTDSLTWEVDVLADGEFEVEVYYTCEADFLGSTLHLQMGDASLQGKVMDSYGQQLIGADEDRVLRQESYEQNWGKMKLGKIKLVKGIGQLTLKAIDIPKGKVMDFRLMTLTRI
ncbi:arylsulfatase [Algoriphagus sanaruensis]|uniref:N-acetylgalactosamine 6-sulfate sulfatase n=1 Tax=Algoriphagus sanaruensis TaxID=1727163 RepID=A0A142EI81_9BACT|nr:arylsulfatase [Algoriphagus sanaruensis]AMQ54836.1 N-acetylgalactosamine 6-sulfate sulfatase [Algoriphagus sanaruensis]